MVSISSYLDPGDIFGFQQSDRISKANAVLDDVQNKANQTSSTNKNLYQNYLDSVNDTYGGTASTYDEDVQALRDLEAYDAGQFEYDKTVNDFFDKYYNQRVNAANKAITNSNANAGNMFSSDYLNALGAKQQALATEAWDNAYNKYNTDKTTEANIWNTNATQGQNAYSNQLNKLTSNQNISQNAQDNLLNAQGNYTTNLANQNNTDLQNYANVAQQKSANNMSEKSLIGRIFG